MPNGPVLSEAERQKLKKQLQDLCTSHWISKGYKRTSIKELCGDAGISIGTFYTLYPAKEDLFLATVEVIQGSLEEQVIAIVKNTPTIDGFASAIKTLAREFDKMPFLYDARTPDFLSFITKLSDKTMEKLKSDRIDFMRKFIRVASLKLKVSEQKAHGVLSALLSTIYAKETISVTFDYFMVFDLMVDGLIPTIFEGEV